MARNEVPRVAPCLRAGPHPGLRTTKHRYGKQEQSPARDQRKLPCDDLTPRRRAAPSGAELPDESDTAVQVAITDGLKNINGERQRKDEPG